MNRSYMLKILIILIQYLVNTFGTQCIFDNGVCTFFDLLMTELNQYFIPSAVNNNNVEQVKFKDSVMHTFTDEVCMAFPNLRDLDIQRLSLKAVASNALHECRNLIKVSMSHNKIKTLDVNLLKGCRKLQVFLCQSNSLETIDGKMFNFVPQLDTLNFGDNFLTKLNFTKFPQLHKLTIMYIFENDLKDLDEEELLLKIPNLNDIYIHNNRFDCSRLEIILEKFRKERVKHREWEKQYRTRNNDLSSINNVECIHNENEPEEEELSAVGSIELDLYEEKRLLSIIMVGGLLVLNILLLIFLGTVGFKIWFLKIEMNDENYYGEYYYSDNEFDKI